MLFLIIATLKKSNHYERKIVFSKYKINQCKNFSRTISVVISVKFTKK